MRRLLIVLLPLLLVLSACSSSSLEDVTVSGGDNPSLKGIKEFSVDDTVTRVITKGDGDEVKKGDTISVQYLAVNGRTGKEFDSTFASGTPQAISLTEGVFPGFLTALPGQKVGSRILVAVPPDEGFNQALEQYDLAKTDTVVFLFDIVTIQPSEATGTAKSLPESLPEITFDKNKHPSGFTATSTTEANPGMGIFTAIEGDGPVIKKGQNLTVEYVGQIYPDGPVFDESWSRGGDPFPVGVGSLYPCWDKQLVGQKVGSRVVVTCPPKIGYSPDSNPPQQADPLKDTLIFVIDLLGAV